MTTADHAAAIREALEYRPLEGQQLRLKADAALAALLAELEAARERLTKEAGLALIEDANRWQRAYDTKCDELEAARAREQQLVDLTEARRERIDFLVSELEAARAALKEIGTIQPKTLAMLREHGVVFDGPLGADPKNFQHVAFSIYNDLCEAESIARAALAAGGEGR